jgi:hypothetical protein
MAGQSQAKKQPALPEGGSDGEQTIASTPNRDLVELTSSELRAIRAVARQPHYLQAIEARDERLIESP